MKVLVIGSGGREHAIAWKLSTSDRVSKVIVAPGNDGMFLGVATHAEKNKYEQWPAQMSLMGNAAQVEFERLARLAFEARVNLVVVGPDHPLAEGIVDVFEKQGLHCFGPSAASARLESSKSFAKEVMKAAGVPTAKFFLASSVIEAHKILENAPWNGAGWVIKADGLALGKGVRVCRNLDEALKATAELISISGKLVIEECLRGEELSWFGFCDGERCALFEPARDYKTLNDFGEGPNTGGMGAFSPVPGIPSHWAARVHAEVFLPVLREMKKRGTPFKGLLYAGLMADVSQDKFAVIEFNARFGDPETQVLLPRMSDDLFSWCQAVAKGDISLLGDRVGFSKNVAVGVVAASRGYPQNPEKGKKLKGAGLARPNLPEAVPSRDTVPEYFFAGVKSLDENLVSSGGRVFLALGMASDFSQARNQAYGLLKEVSFEGLQNRTDIAAGISR